MSYIRHFAFHLSVVLVADFMLHFDWPSMIEGTLI